MCSQVFKIPQEFWNTCKRIPNSSIYSWIKYFILISQLMVTVFFQLDNKLMWLMRSTNSRLRKGSPSWRETKTASPCLQGGRRMSSPHLYWCRYANCYFSSTLCSLAPASRINGNFTCQIWHKKGQATSLAEQYFPYDFSPCSTQCQMVAQFKSRDLSKITSSCWSSTCLNKQTIHQDS